jgi:peptidylprolyl isomerase
MVRCYLDLDIDDARASFARATEFVKTQSLKYGLSSDDILKLGGREVLSLEEMYNNDYYWSQKGPLRTRPQPLCRIIVELYPTQAPLASANFLALCKGDKGKSKGSGVALHYKNSRLHRYVPGFIIQGGDFVMGNGSGGCSIYNDKKFKDDPQGLKLKHDCRGVLSMGNSGKNSNSSQFFFTLSNNGAPQCDKKHVVFGKIVEGGEVLTYMEDELSKHKKAGRKGPEGEDESPCVEVTITECGEWSDGMAKQGYWNSDGIFKELRSDDDIDDA